MADVHDVTGQVGVLDCFEGLPKGLGGAVGASPGYQTFALPQGNLDLIVAEDAVMGDAWVLVGRGRDGWAWNDNGRGSPSAWLAQVGTSSAFSPEYLGASTIRDLLEGSELDLTDVEIRIRRAADADGIHYQETIWQSVGQLSWTWLFD